MALDQTHVEHRTTILAVRKLADSSFQSLLNYSSSRCRAIAYTYAMRRSTFGEPEEEEFLTQFENELVCPNFGWFTIPVSPLCSQSIGNFLVGMGVTMHDSRVFPPRALRGLTQMMLNCRLGQLEDLLRAAQDSNEQEDRILPQYQCDWWSRFPQVTTPLQITPNAIIEAWKTQFSTLPSPVLLNHPTLLSLGALPDENLGEAIVSGRDALRLIEMEIKRNQRHLEEVAGTLGKLRVLRLRLAKLEEKGVQEEMRVLAG